MDQLGPELRRQCINHPEMKIASRFCFDLNCKNSFRIQCNHCQYQCMAGGHLHDVEEILDVSDRFVAEKYQQWRHSRDKLHVISKNMSEVFEKFIAHFDEAVAKAISILTVKFAAERDHLLRFYGSLMKEYELRNQEFDAFYAQNVQGLEQGLQKISRSSVVEKVLAAAQTQKPNLQGLFCEIRDQINVIQEARGQLDKSQLKLQTMVGGIEKESIHAGRMKPEGLLHQMIWDELDTRFDDLTLIVKTPFMHYFSKLTVQQGMETSLDPGGGPLIIAKESSATLLTDTIAQSELDASAMICTLQSLGEEPVDRMSSYDETLILNQVDYYQLKQQLREQGFGYSAQNLAQAVTLQVKQGLASRQQLQLNHQVTYCMLGIPNCSQPVVVSAGDMYILLWSYESLFDEWRILSRLQINDFSTKDEHRSRIYSMQVLYNPYKQASIDPKTPLSFLIIAGGNMIELFALNLNTNTLISLIRVRFKGTIFINNQDSQIIHSILPLQNIGSWKHFITGNNQKYNIILYKFLPKDDKENRSHRLQQTCIIEAHANSVVSLINLNSSVIASSSADNMIKLWTINLSEKKNAIKPKLSLTQQSYEILGMKQVVQNQFLTFHSGLTCGFHIYLWELMNDQKEIKRVCSTSEKTDEIIGYTIMRNPENLIDFVVLLLVRTPAPTKTKKPLFKVMLLDRQLVKVSETPPMQEMAFSCDQLINLKNKEVHLLTGQSIALASVETQIARQLVVNSSVSNQNEVHMPSLNELKQLTNLQAQFLVLNQYTDQAPFVQVTLGIKSK